MDPTKVLSLLEDLDDEIDELEESLAPLLKSALSETTSKLPLLDKAKLYVLITYAIESLLFSYLRLNGVKAREHPVFLELSRVKQYFDKIKQIETPALTRNSVLDKDAAGRFIKASLAGNDKYDLIRAEEQAKERAKAHIRFKDSSENMGNKKRQSEQTEAPDEQNTSDSEGDSDTDHERTIESTEGIGAVDSQGKKQPPDNARSAGEPFCKKKDKSKKVNQWSKKTKR